MLGGEPSLIKVSSYYIYLKLSILDYDTYLFYIMTSHRKGHSLALRHTAVQEILIGFQGR